MDSTVEGRGEGVVGLRERGREREKDPGEKKGEKEGKSMEEKERRKGRIKSGGLFYFGRFAHSRKAVVSRPGLTGISDSP